MHLKCAKASWQAITREELADLDAFPVPMLLFKGHKLLVDILSLCLGNVVKGILVNSTRSFRFFALLLKLCKLNEQLLLQSHAFAGKHCMTCQKACLKSGCAALQMHT